MGAPDPGPAFSFYLSSDVALEVEVRVDRLAGAIPAYRDIDAAPGGAVRPSALRVEAAVCAAGAPVAPPVATRWAEAALDGCAWGGGAEGDGGGAEPAGERLVFPIRYRDLPADALLALTVWEDREGAAAAAPLAGATVRLFSARGRLKTGRQALRLWEGRAADAAWPPATPGTPAAGAAGEAARLRKALRRHARGEVPPLPWLDALALPAARAALAAAEAAGGGALSLVVALPEFPHAVLFREAAAPADRDAAAADAPAAPAPGASAGATAAGAAAAAAVVVHDPEAGLENLAELKAAKLARAAGRGAGAGAAGGAAAAAAADRFLRPDTHERQRLEAVLAAPPGAAPDAADRALMWRFRHALRREPRALPRFLRCVDWGDAAEAAEAGELMAAWAPVGAADALELLSPDFGAPAVRAHAVAALEAALAPGAGGAGAGGGGADAELLGVLLQLVQALRYEADGGEGSPLAAFLVRRCAASTAAASALYWYCCPELEDPVFGERFAAVQGALLAALPPRGAARASLSAQVQLVARLQHLAAEVGRPGAARTAGARAEALRALLGPDGACADLAHFRCPSPLDPSVRLAGVVPAACSVFRSERSPLLLVFKREADGEGGGGGPGGPRSPRSAGAPPSPSSPAAGAGTVGVIFKRGDDLRQDQLALQLFALMDRLLRRQGMDLKVTAYRVLPTSPTDGLIELVPGAAPLSALRGAGAASIRGFLAKHNAGAAASAAALDTFVASAAGACVLSYVLGVGDRHLDNVLLAPDGRLFHIDFGYLLGRDPKPFAPPLRLTPEVVDALGGAGSPHYRRFVSLACEAYNALRRSAGLLASLVHLCAGAPIPDVARDPEKALLTLAERLRPGAPDDEAAAWMARLLAEAPGAVMPQIMETAHRVMQVLR